MAVGESGCPAVKLVTSTDNFIMGALELLDDELDITLDDMLALLIDEEELLFLLSPPQAVKSMLTRSADKTIGMFFMAVTYCTVTVTRATGFSQR